MSAKPESRPYVQLLGKELLKSYSPFALVRLLRFRSTKEQEQLSILCFLVQMFPLLVGIFALVPFAARVTTAVAFDGLAATQWSVAAWIAAALYLALQIVRVMLRRGQDTGMGPVFLLLCLLAPVLASFLADWLPTSWSTPVNATGLVLQGWLFCMLLLAPHGLWQRAYTTLRARFSRKGSSADA